MRASLFGICVPGSLLLIPAAHRSFRAKCPQCPRISSRWKDNDVYGHVNNVEYYSYFDTVINEYLIRHGGLDIHRGALIGLCAESHCKFVDSLAFPDAVDAGLRAAHQIGSAACREHVCQYV